MKEFLNSIGDNYIWVAGGAAVLLLIIIVAAAGRNKKKKTEDREERNFFLEGEYDSMIRDEARAKHAAAAEPETEEMAEPAEVIEGTEDEKAALKEELQQVQINISIERGQVHIGYEEDGRLSCVVEDMLKEAEGETQEMSEMSEMPEMPVPEIREGHEVLANQGIVLEKIELVKASPARKFGPDNFNTGRSGRVFTEEELREQIKQ